MPTLIRKHLTRCLIFLCIPLVLGLTACQKEAPPQTVTGFAFDTYYQFTLYGDDEEKGGDATSLIASYEALFSATRKDATLYSLNENGDNLLALDEELTDLLADALSLAEKTEGAFDPTLGTLRELWRIDEQDTPLPTNEAVMQALSHTGWAKLRLDKEGQTLFRSDAAIRLDLGGIAKGWAVSRLAEYYTTSGIAGGALDFGGTVAVFGEKPTGEPFRIGIRNPYQPNATAPIGYLTLTGTAPTVVSVAGLYERNKVVDGITYGHIFDAKTGYPAKSDLISVAVICEDGATADALCTAFLVMGGQKAVAFCEENMQKDAFGAILFFADGTKKALGDVTFTETAQ